MASQAESENAAPAADAAPSVGLDSSTYEIIRNRLQNSGKDLRSRLDQLNAARKDVFGSIETSLLRAESLAPTTRAN